MLQLLGLPNEFDKIQFSYFMGFYDFLDIMMKINNDGKTYITMREEEMYTTHTETGRNVGTKEERTRKEPTRLNAQGTK